jgi:four helix bundle protein
MRLEDLDVYRMAMDIGERTWDIVAAWDFFAKDTVGKQLVKAADSVASNLSEGYGRFHYRESRHFGYYARGSLYETVTWLRKARRRDLLATDVFAALRHDINTLAKKLNRYISSIGPTPSVQEALSPYGGQGPDATLPEDDLPLPFADNDQPPAPASDQ